MFVVVPDFSVFIHDLTLSSNVTSRISRKNSNFQEYFAKTWKCVVQICLQRKVTWHGMAWHRMTRLLIYFARGVRQMNFSNNVTRKKGFDLFHGEANGERSNVGFVRYLNYCNVDWNFLSIGVIWQISPQSIPNSWALSVLYCLTGAKRVEKYQLGSVHKTTSLGCRLAGIWRDIPNHMEKGARTTHLGLNFAELLAGHGWYERRGSGSRCHLKIELSISMADQIPYRCSLDWQFAIYVVAEEINIAGYQ